MTNHAKLGPSGAHRWLVCGGSVDLEAEYPDSTSHAAAEGTAAHALGEMCLRDESNADTHLGETLEGFVVDQEMVDAIQEYLDYVRQFDGTLLVEKKVSFSWWVPNGFGTADAVVIGENATHVIDLKYGKGVPVSAEHNPQAMMYALGVHQQFGHLLESENIVLHVVQPRLNSTTDFSLTVDQLVFWAENTVAPAAKLALSGTAPLVPGDKQCKFCKAKGACPALRDHSLRIMGGDFEALGEGEAPGSLLSDQEVSKLLPALPLVSDWAKGVEKEAESRMLAGRKLDGYKLVRSRKNKAWTDEKRAQAALLTVLSEDAAFKKTLVTPTQAKKLLGKQDAHVIDGLVETPVGLPTIAKDSDKRPAIEVDHAQDFATAA